MKARWPRLSRALGTAYRSTLGQLLVEAGVIRQVGLRRLWAELAGRRRPGGWETALPVQRPGRVAVPALDARHWQDFTVALASAGLPYAEGTHTVYLPPEALQHAALRHVAAGYPADAGLKLAKNPGGVDDSSYVHGQHWSEVQKRLTNSHRRLTLVANLLADEGLGPRLYDLIELVCGSTVWTAYVVQHVRGRTPTLDECREGIGRLQALVKRGAVSLANTDGFAHNDFQPPACNGNAVMDAASGAFRYIDFQNILLDRYGQRLDRVASEAQSASHFGMRSVLRGGAYLYQSVPGSSLPAKRDTALRARTIAGLLASAGASVDGRVVLDVGCNVGMMMAQYLNLGARWCVGWDMPQIAPHTRRLLSALGCTRFTAHGTELRGDAALEEGIPGFLTGALDGCVISFLAMHAHVGWLDAFGRLPWAHMIFESHEDESPDEVLGHLEGLKPLSRFRVAKMAVYQDGDCRPRTVAVLTREPRAAAIPARGLEAA